MLSNRRVMIMHLFDFPTQCFSHQTTARHYLVASSALLLKLPPGGAKIGAYESEGQEQATDCVTH